MHRLQVRVERLHERGRREVRVLVLLLDRWNINHYEAFLPRVPGQTFVERDYFG